jgi:hypothetical protein
MRIFSNSVVSTFLLSAAAMTNIRTTTTTTTTDAFTPINIIKNKHNININFNKNSARVSSSSSSSSSSSNSIIVLSASEPCDMPSDIEEIDGTLKNSKSLRNAIVTNIDGEQIELGDMMGIEKDKPMTSVVVFLRHMG